MKVNVSHPDVGSTRSRIRSVTVDPELLAALFEEGRESHTRVQVGLPAGARLQRFFGDEWGNLVLIFEHESFPPVCNGEPIPPATVSFSTVYCGAR